MRVLALALTLTACETAARDTVTLAPGAHVQRTLSASEPLAIGLELARDEGASLTVAQRGVDVVVSIIDPSGATVARIDRVGGRVGVEPVALRADRGGTWTLAIAPARGEPAGEVIVTRPATSQAARVDALVSLTRGDARQSAGDGDSLRAARRAHDDARAGFVALADRWGEAIALDELGRVERTLGDRRQAIVLRERALAMREADGDRYGVERSALGLANLYSWFGDDDTSVALYRRALVAARAIDDVRGVAVITTNLGMVWSDAGDYVRALAAYGEALAVQDALGDDHGAAFSHQGLGATYRRLGDAVGAKAHIRAALTLREALGETRWAAGDHYALALVHLELDDDDLAAVDELELALSLREGLGYFSDRDPEVRIALGRAYAGLGLTDEATDLIDEARAESLALGGDASQADLALGDVALASHDPATALARYQRVLSHGDEPLRNALRAGTGMARARLALGDRDGARVVLTAALTRFESVREALPPATLRGLWLGHWRVLHDLLVSLELGGATPDVDRAFRAHERGLARALLDDLEPHGQVELGIADVQRALGRDEGLVSFALGDDQGWAFRVTRDHADTVPLGPREPIATCAASLVHALMSRAEVVPDEPTALRARRIADADARVPELAAELAAIMWAPLGDDLPARLIVIADSGLAGVPFELLPTADGTPVLDHYELTLAPSAATWRVLRERAPAPTPKTTVLADPVFSAADPRLATQSDVVPAFPRLHFSAIEAQAIHAADATADLVLGLAATRDRLVAPPGGVSPLARDHIIHLASHVVIDADDPDRSAVVLSQVDARGDPRDGLLTARDARALGLSADLVVLSGCASAQGRVARGEGVMGLARAFLEGGARRVLASRWRVHDRGTAELMAHFYDGLRRGQTIATALRDAARALRADPRWSAPYYWAAWSLIGG